MSRTDSLSHARIPNSPAQVPCSYRAMRNLSELPSHMSVKPRELALNTICNTPGLANGIGPLYRGVGPTYVATRLRFRHRFAQNG